MNTFFKTNLQCCLCKLCRLLNFFFFSCLCACHMFSLKKRVFPNLRIYLDVYLMSQHSNNLFSVIWNLAITKPSQGNLEDICVLFFSFIQPLACLCEQHQALAGPSVVSRLMRKKNNKKETLERSKSSLCCFFNLTEVFSSAPRLHFTPQRSCLCCKRAVFLTCWQPAPCFQTTPGEIMTDQARHHCRPWLIKHPVQWL